MRRFTRTETEREKGMLDAIMVALTVVAFAALIGYAYLCEQL